MSHLHFVAADDYRSRVIQLGEQPEKVFKVGGLGVDNIQNLELLERDILEESLGLQFATRNLMITFHPVTLDSGSSEGQMEELLAALRKLKDTHLIFTMPNADTDGRVLFKQIEKFVSKLYRNLEDLGQNEIMSKTIGKLVMEGLKEIDPVAYVRFASVYTNFKEVKDFEDFVGNLNVYKHK